jgi:hypothetical protein
MAKDASLTDFFVDIIAAGPYSFIDNRITGKLNNFNLIV